MWVTNCRRFSRLPRSVFQSANTTRVVAQMPRDNHFLASRIASLLPGKLQRCRIQTAIIRVKIPIHSENRQSKHSTRPLLVQTCKCTCYLHRAGSCKFNQSRAQAVPVECSSAAGTREGGREGAQRSSTQFSTRSPGQKQMMSHCAKTLIRFQWFSSQWTGDDRFVLWSAQN